MNICMLCKIIPEQCGYYIPFCDEFSMKKSGQWIPSLTMQNNWAMDTSQRKDTWQNLQRFT